MNGRVKKKSIISLPLPPPPPLPNTMCMRKGEIASHHGDRVECSHNHHHHSHPSSSDDEFTRSDNKITQLAETASNEISNLTQMKRDKLSNSVQSLKQSLKVINGNNDQSTLETNEQQEQVESTSYSSSSPTQLTIGFGKEFESHIGWQSLLASMIISITDDITFCFIIQLNRSIKK